MIGDVIRSIPVELLPNGVWITRVSTRKFTARTLGRLRRTVRTFLRNDDPEVDFEFQLLLPDEIDSAIERQKSQYEALEFAADVYEKATIDLIELLKNEFGRGTRDIATLIDTSHQHVSLILKGTKRKGARRDLRTRTSRVPRR